MDQRPSRHTTTGEALQTGPQINVAQLLKQPVGATRRYQIEIEALPLDAERQAHDLHGSIKLLRVGTGLLVVASLSGAADLTCVRCLNDYAQPLTLEMEDEFRPTIDIVTGQSTAVDRAVGRVNEEYFLIEPNHVIDLSEAVRQAVWLATPIAPHCREDCPGIAFEQPTDEAEADPPTPAAAAIDERLAILGQLLAPEAASDPPAGSTRRQRGGARRRS